MELCDMKSGDFNLSRIKAMHQLWKNGSSYNYLERSRPDNAIKIILSGTFEYTFPDGSVYTTHPGDIIYIPKGTNYLAKFYASDSQNFASDYLINFISTDESGNEIVFFDNITKICTSEDNAVITLFEKAYTSFKNNSLLTLKSTCYKLFNYINKMSKSTNLSLDDALLYIERNFNSKLSIDDIAKMCSMSPTSFRQKFSEKTDLTPLNYINALKIKKACELLCSSEITIDEISTFLNFYDTSHFCKKFKSIMGVSPTDYRKNPGEIYLDILA